MTQCQLMFPVFVVYAVQVFPHCAVGEKGNGEGGREGVLGRRRRRGGSAGGGGEGGSAGGKWDEVREECWHERRSAGGGRQK